jgi:predicted nucleic acid-binding protein
MTIEYGGVLYTSDRDFARFPGLRWVNPLAGN